MIPSRFESAARGESSRTGKPSQSSHAGHQPTEQHSLLSRRGSSTLILDVDETDLPTSLTLFKDASVPIFRIPGCRLGWENESNYRYDGIIQKIEALLHAVPAVQFLIEVTVQAPTWWCKHHIDECAGFLIPATEEAGSVPIVSWASQRWRREGSEALSRLIRHLKDKPWGGQWLGIQLSWDDQGGWVHPEVERLPDNGPRMTERFRNYVLDKYRRNGGLLKKAWGDTRSDFSRIEAPGVTDRTRAEIGVFRHPVRNRRLLDYYESYYTAQCDTLLDFASAAKSAAHGRLAVGAAWGCLPTGIDTAEAIQGLPETVLASDTIDFIVMSEGASGLPHSLTGSTALHEKAVLYVVKSRPGPFQVGVALTHHASLLSRISPAVAVNEAHEIVLRAVKAFSGRPKRTSQIAVIVDPAASALLGRDRRGKQILQRLFDAQIGELAQIGAPYDVYTTPDLSHPKFPDYRVYLFLTGFFFTEAERRKIDARVKRSEQVGVWLWGAGMQHELGIGVDAGSRLTGQKIRMEQGDISLRTRIAQSEDPLTRGYHVGANFGSEEVIAPILTVADRQATRLGANTGNKTVFSVRRFETWTSVVFGTCPAPAALLRNLLRDANCHLYMDSPQEGDRIVAHEQCLAVRTERGGKIRLSLPALSTVTDALTGERLGITSNLELEMAPHSERCLLLRLQPRSKSLKSEPNH